MSNYLVCYDLVSPGQNYEDLIKHLESYPVHWHFQKSAWIVGPSSSALAVANEVWKHIDQNDKLFVQAVTPDCAWAGYDERGAAWLRQV